MRLMGTKLFQFSDNIYVASRGFEAVFYGFIQVDRILATCLFFIIETLYQILYTVFYVVAKHLTFRESKNWNTD
jgi:hypothetical protein